MADDIKQLKEEIIKARDERDFLIKQEADKKASIAVLEKREQELLASVDALPAKLEKDMELNKQDIETRRKEGLADLDIKQKAIEATKQRNDDLLSQNTKILEEIKKENDDKRDLLVKTQSSLLDRGQLEALKVEVDRQTIENKDRDVLMTKRESDCDIRESAISVREEKCLAREKELSAKEVTVKTVLDETQSKSDEVDSINKQTKETNKEAKKIKEQLDLLYITNRDEQQQLTMRSEEIDKREKTIIDKEKSIEMDKKNLAGEWQRFKEESSNLVMIMKAKQIEGWEKLLYTKE